MKEKYFYIDLTTGDPYCVELTEEELEEALLNSPEMEMLIEDNDALLFKGKRLKVEIAKRIELIED
jgi:hypothetical protein